MAYVTFPSYKKCAMIASIADRLRKVRREAGYETAADAARAHNWNVNTVVSNENGNRAPGRKAVIQYARAYHVSADWLLTGQGEKQPSGGSSLRQIPIVHWEAISNPNSALRIRLLKAEPWDYFAVLSAQSLGPDAFGLEVRDDSMVDPTGSPHSLYPGDIAVIDLPGPSPAKPGSRVLAQAGERLIIRKMRVMREYPDGSPAQVILVPFNPDYGAHEAHAEEVLGAVVGLYRRSPAA